MKRNKKFNKTSSIRNKILLPFVIIIAILAISSVFISNYALTDMMNRQTISKMNNASVSFSRYMQSVIDNYVFYSRLLPKFQSVNQSFKKDIQSYMPQYSDKGFWNNTKIYTNLKYLNPAQQGAYQSIINSAKNGLRETGHFVRQINDTVKLVSVSVIPRENNKSNPILTEHYFDSYLPEEINMDDTSHAALLYFNPELKESHTHILSATSKIRASTAMRKKLKRLIYQQKYHHRDSFYTTTRLGDVDYTILITKLSFINPNVYSVILKSSEGVADAKFKIVVGMVMVLFLIGLGIFGVYALIIRKITSSIDILSSVSENVASGDLDQRVFLETGDEIGKLANSFNQMIHNLRDSSVNLIHEKERSEAIISFLPEGIIVTDQENRLILANRRAEEMFNFSTNEVQGKYLLEYINNEEMLKALSENREIDRPIRHEIVIPDTNHDRNYSLVSSLVKTQFDEPVGVITVLRDQTHEKQIEELKDGFLRTVTHELRTPLTSVIGFIELVQLSSELDDEKKGYLTTALNEAASLKTLIDDLLDLSQLKAGKIKMSESMTSITELLDSVISTFKPLADRKDLKLEFKKLNKDISIKVDAAKLRRIFLNLISNAIKFTEKGSVTISCEDREDELYFSVKDTGIGLREEEKDVIFEKFRQVDYSSRRKYEGIGLGLSIVQQLVELHHGDISVESEYKKGSTFSFTIKKK